MSVEAVKVLEELMLYERFEEQCEETDEQAIMTGEILWPLRRFQR